MAEITRQMLRDYLHDALPDPELVAVEKALRESAKLRALYKEVVEQEDRGEHTLGAIWRRERISCLSRDQLGRLASVFLAALLWASAKSRSARSPDPVRPSSCFDESATPVAR